jgi:DNA-binding beta-propeller fold protein YncE
MSIFAPFRKQLIYATLSAVLVTAAGGLAASPPEHKGFDDLDFIVSETLPTGHIITPLAIPGSNQQLLNPGLEDYPDFVAGGAVRSELSPDGKTLAILVAGQNNVYEPDGDLFTRTQYIFLYDVTGENKKQPLLTRVIQQPNTHVGMVWSPDGNTLYATGGRDDAVYVYSKDGDLLNAIALDHEDIAGDLQGVGLNVLPNAGGLAVSDDGKTLVVVNNYNDSISVIDTASGSVRYEHDLRPFFANNEGTDGVPGGTFPFAVTIKGNHTAYVSANRDREVVVIDISGPDAGSLITRIKLNGNPLGMTLDAAQEKLYVAQDNADEVAVIDTMSNSIIATIDARAPVEVLALMDGGDKRKGKRDDDDDAAKDEHDDDDGHKAGRDDDDGNKAARHTGVSPFSVRISPDGKTLYAVNDGANSVAVIPLRGKHANQVIGLIPTAYAPRDITFSADGKWMYIINGKSVTGPNQGHLTSYTYGLTSSTYIDGIVLDQDGEPVEAVKTDSYPLGDDCDADCVADNVLARENSRGTNQYQFQLEKSSLVSAPVPDLHTLRKLTQQVALNNSYIGDQDGHSKKVMDFLSKKIKHIIYVVKENRTFDQVLGDLYNGSNGDDRLTVFGEAITPSQHALARNFVTLDNFYDPGDGSMDGWSWTMQGRVTSTEGLTQQLAYGGHGLSYESEGSNRNVPVNWETVEERDAAVCPEDDPTCYTDTATAENLPGGVENLLAGARNHASTDASFGEEEGFIWNAVLEAGGTVRNYGFVVRNFGDRVEDPYDVSEVQVGPLYPSLPRVDFADPSDELPAGSTDVYFRGYDMAYPDYWRYKEWKREFDMYVENGKLPNLSLVRMPHDHMGSFSSAVAGVNTPETQMADNDYVVGKMVEDVANSPYANDTLFIIIQDDCQDGPDHVDSHRTTTYMVGPYVKKGAVISTFYTQVNVLRTIEDLLGAPHINLNTATQPPMADVFDIKSSPDWTFQALASTVLTTTELDLPPDIILAKGPLVMPKHDAEYWAKVTSHLDFSDADLITPLHYNKILWEGLMGDKPYPRVHSRWSAANID